MTGNGVPIPPIMLMTRGWCQWHCFPYIEVDIFCDFPMAFPWQIPIALKAPGAWRSDTWRQDQQRIASQMRPWKLRWTIPRLGPWGCFLGILSGLCWLGALRGILRIILGSMSVSWMVKMWSNEIETNLERRCDRTSGEDRTYDSLELVISSRQDRFVVLIDPKMISGS